MALSEEERKRIHEEERERSRVQREIEKKQKTKTAVQGLAGCLILLLVLFFAVDACVSWIWIEPTEPSQEEKEQEAALLKDLRTELGALDPLSTLFTPAMCSVYGEVAHVYVKNTWYDLSERGRRDTLNRVTQMWSRLTGRTGASWFLYDTGNHALGGHSVFKGDYLKD